MHHIPLIDPRELSLPLLTPAPLHIKLEQRFLWYHSPDLAVMVKVEILPLLQELVIHPPRIQMKDLGHPSEGTRREELPIQFPPVFPNTRPSILGLRLG